MDKTQDSTKKCFCARCFLPVEADDRVDIEGQNFHRVCSMCCVCRTIPTSVKMFYGHVFCSECFKTHVLCRFRNDVPQMHSNTWWMQWAPGVKPSHNDNNEKDGEQNQDEQKAKRSICTRCLQPVDDNNKVEIGGQCFHTQCAKCYFCHEVPTSKLKIYYGQVFCEDCFHRHVLNRGKDNPSDFFKQCFDQWQNNAMFAENMRQFMNGNKESAPFVFMMQGPQSTFCRCGTGPQEWFQQNEPKKSLATFSTDGESFGTCDLTFELRTEVSEIPRCVFKESANEKENTATAVQKIEKLTKYLQKKHCLNVSKESCKKWKSFVELDKVSLLTNSDESFSSWANFQNPTKLSSTLKCPKCLWQCGPIYVNSEFLQKEIVCGDYLGSSFTIKGFKYFFFIFPVLQLK